MANPNSERPRILSGMRPTGRLHLGNLVGALQNWVALQHVYDSYHFVADWHMLTSNYADTSALQTNILEMVRDWLAVGLDPSKATFFQQSRLVEHAELQLLFSMVTPLGWLERVPSYKEQLENVKDRDLHTYGFLGYPVLQAADILMYKPKYVPVGEDQVPHVEITREIARRFNAYYGWDIKDDLFEPNNREHLRRALLVFERLWRLPHDTKEFNSLSGSRAKGRYGSSLRSCIVAYTGFQGFLKALPRAPGPRNTEQFFPERPVFPEPEALLTPTPRLPGTDGRKMSKSYNNAIFLSDPPEEVSSKVANMMTDPARKRRTDPGNPDVCPVFDHHKIFSAREVVEQVNRECRTAEIGCVDCKKLMAAHLNQFLAPIHDRRKDYEENPHLVWDILEEGTERARRVAEATMAEVRQAMNLTKSETRNHKAELVQQTTERRLGLSS